MKNSVSRLSLAFLLITVLSLQMGCSSNRSKGVMPEKAFKLHKKQAVVLISTSLDSGLSKINGIEVMPHFSPTREVFAFYVDKNKSFRLKNMTFNTTDGSKTITFSHAKSLPISHTGIYFYGNLYKQGRLIFLDYLQHPKTMEYASYRYSQMFNTISPINFDY